MIFELDRPGFEAEVVEKLIFNLPGTVTTQGHCMVIISHLILVAR